MFKSFKLRKILRGVFLTKNVPQALKTGAFGVLISLIICYHGLAQPLRLEEVSRATTRTVAQSVIACLLIDGIFIILYLLI